VLPVYSAASMAPALRWRAADRDPDSPTATSGFDDRAQDAAGHNDAEDPYDYDDYGNE
jgi:hypothetical protein